MARLQYKICTGPVDGSGHCHEVHVYARTVSEAGEFGPWKHVAQRGVYMEPILSTHGQRLKALLRSLA